MSKKQSINRSGPQQLFYTEAFKQKILIVELIASIPM